MKSSITAPKAMTLILLLGAVSLFADVTYEGARSIAGPFMAGLGASAAVVGIVAGAGELIGFALRLVSGIISDRTQKYWLVTILGYSINLIAVPLLALADNWPLASGLLIAERMGKAIRAPARDAILSHASHKMGRGWGFGVHEALDQVGAMLGPLIVACVLFFKGVKGGYAYGFAVLAIPAALALIVLVLARTLYPRPQDLEVRVAGAQRDGFPKVFWLYVTAAGLVAVGYVDFPLIAFHFERTGEVPPVWIPVLYSIAMGVDAIAALVFGKLFDRHGLFVLVFSTSIGLYFAPLVFVGGFYPALIGMALWGLGMGAQESVMRAAVSAMAPADRRGTAFGTFNAIYGVSWFLGSVAMGFIYTWSPLAMMLFSVGLQASAVPIFWRLRHGKHS